MPQVKKKHRACKTNLAEARKARWADRVAISLVEPKPNTLFTNEAEFTSESVNELEPKPLLLKEEEEDETEMECEDDNLEQETTSDPLQPNESNNDFSEQKQTGCHCLICGCLELDPRPLKGILPNTKRLTNPGQLEDDLRIIYVLKMIFQLTTSELRYLMKLSNGQSPQEWIHLCQSCRLLIFEIQTLEDRMRECRRKIKEKIMKSSEDSSSSMTPLWGGTMTHRIRSLVKQQVRSARTTNTVFIDGDRKAEELVKLKLRKSSNESTDALFFVNCSYPENSNGNYEDSPEEMNESSSPSEDLNSETITTNAPCASLPKEFYVCPYCPSEKWNPSKMDFVELFYHLIFLHDNPMKCSECSVFLGRDSSVLDSHWQQYHFEVNTPSIARFIETQFKLDFGFDKFDTPSEAATSPKNSQRISIKCTDCSLETEFDCMKKFKIHQALRHPYIARLSCPLCPKKLTPEENEDVLRDHLRIMHKVLPIQDMKGSQSLSSCKFCKNGPPISPKRYKANAALLEALHLLSSHGSLVQASYTCIPCSKESFNLEEFLEHVKTTPGHKEHVNVEGVWQLYNYSSHSVTCPLCVGEQSCFVFKTVQSFFSHLADWHFLNVKWKTDPMNSSSVLSDSIEMNWAKYTYVCPSCPNLKTMNLDTFLAHLVFHWRRPNKCTSCKAYLPFASEVIHDHWKNHHPDLDSPTMAKVETVQFTPGNVFPCGKCSERFPSFKERDNHEMSSHGCSSERTKTCGVCNESFPNTEDIRLHKAIDHPEIASVSCYYCEELFPAESLEGVQFLDYDALKKHILETEDHRRMGGAGTSTIFHLCACDFCGKIVEDDTKNTILLRTHIMRKHNMDRKIILARNAPLWCFICNAELRALSLQDHLSKTHAKNSICETCGEELRPWSLPDHCLVKHDVLLEGYQEKCCGEEGCDYKTVYQSKMSHHISVHHNKQRQRPHKCSVCPKAFFTLSNLKEHEKRHQNKETRPFQCEICGGSYAVRNDLYIHKRLSHLNLKFPSTNRKRSKRVSVPPATIDETDTETQK